MPDWYTRLSLESGASFAATWSNADVVLAAFGVFVILFALGAVAASNMLADASFLVLVAGGLLVAWPAMIALSMAAMIAAAVVSFAHRALAPKRAAEIEAEAEALAGEALRGLADAPGLRSDVAQRLRERPGGVASPPDR